MAESSVIEIEFETYRRLLFTIAYRMLGSAAEAEDLVQDAYLRFASTDREVVRDVKAFLTTILTRLALDRLRSAQLQREEYIGPWLPEPVLTGEGADPGQRVERDETVSFALLTALETLTPQERAVLLLYEVLDHDHNEIAEMLEITPAASRQLLHRARERVGARKRFTPSREEQQRLIAGFTAAVQRGDLHALRQVLASDVVMRSDGGGKVNAARNPVYGNDNVSRFFLGVVKKLPAQYDVYVDEVNGAQGLIVFVEGRLFEVLTFEFDGDRIAEVGVVLNPDKLRFVERQRRASGE